MGKFRRRMKERQQAREISLSFGWLAAIPDVIVTITLVLLYRLIHVMSVTGFRGEDLFNFWCSYERGGFSLHTSYMAVFVCLCLWVALAAYVSVGNQGAFRWTFVVRGLTLLLLGGYIYVLVGNFGGFSCSKRSPVYEAIELEKQRTGPYRVAIRLTDEEAYEPR